MMSSANEETYGSASEADKWTRHSDGGAAYDHGLPSDDVNSMFTREVMMCIQKGMEGSSRFNDWKDDTNKEPKFESTVDDVAKILKSMGFSDARYWAEDVVYNSVYLNLREDPSDASRLIADNGQSILYGDYISRSGGKAPSNAPTSPHASAEQNTGGDPSASTERKGSDDIESDDVKRRG